MKQSLILAAVILLLFVLVALCADPVDTGVHAL